MSNLAFAASFATLYHITPNKLKKTNTCSSLSLYMLVTLHLTLLVYPIHFTTQNSLIYMVRSIILNLPYLWKHLYHLPYLFPRKNFQCEVL